MIEETPKMLASRRLRLLVVMPFLPVPPNFGGKVRLYHVLRELARLHDVTLVCWASQEEERLRGEIEAWGVRIFSLHREVTRRPWWRHLAYLPTRIPFRLVEPDPSLAALVERVWREGSFDAVQVEFVSLAFSVAHPMFSGRRFLTLHCSTSDDVRRDLAILSRRSLRYWYVRLDGLKVPSFERRSIRYFERAFVTSTTDRRLISALDPSLENRFVVANNGVDTEHFVPLEDPGGPPTVISTCSFVTDANLDGVLYFLREVWPLVHARHPEARYRVVGFGAPPHLRETAGATPGVEFVGEVDDVRPYLAGSRASLVIMRAGSGTKIRAFTSLAMGIPLIATPLGAEGIEASEAQGLTVRSSSEGLAAAVLEALAHPVPPEVATNARHFVAAHHSWKQVALRMTDTYLSVLPS